MKKEWSEIRTSELNVEPSAAINGKTHIRLFVINITSLDKLDYGFLLKLALSLF